MADIGEKLRSAREEKGFSISDIEKATKIQSRYLEAIEQDQFDKLPGDFYVRAFIRQYAQIVDLDGKELLSEYHQDVPEAKPDEYVENSIDNKSEEVRETTNNKKDLWKNYLPRIAVGLGVIVVVLVVYFLYARLSSSGQNNTDNNVAVSSQNSSSKKPAVKTNTNSVKVKALGNNQYQVTGLKDNRKLELAAGNQTVTATVTVDGTSQFQQTLTANQKHTLVLPATAKNVVVTFSNDTGTSVKIAGKKVPYTANGQYLSLTLILGKTSQSSSQSSSQTQTNNNYNSGQTNQSSSQSHAASQSSSQSNNQTKTSQTNNNGTQTSNQTNNANNQTKTNSNNKQ